MAFSTGFVDALECVWVKVGIDSTSNLHGANLDGSYTGEFTPGNSAGRINLYYGTGTGNGGAFIYKYGATGCLTSLTCSHSQTCTGGACTCNNNSQCPAGSTCAGGLCSGYTPPFEPTVLNSSPTVASAAGIQLPRC